MGILTLLLFAGLAGAKAPDAWTMPIETKTLANGLTVVVSEDHSSPTVGVSVVYKVGMRLEPNNRTGFAHLFEHLMFEGTPQAPSGVFDRVIQGGGGIMNGSTRLDFTNYIESAPVSALEPILWLEADRMTMLDFNAENLKNQQDVVKEEIRVNVKNQPYGLFFWTDLADLAFDKWENSHDGYGSFQDLENAALEDVKAFHRDYYGPNNAVIGIVGDVAPEEAFRLVDKYFSGIAARPTPPRPDVSEPLNTAPRRADQTDALARIPAVAIGYKAPPRNHPDHAPIAVLADLLVGGPGARLHQSLVKTKQIAVEVEGGLNWPLGGPLDYDGPMLVTLFAPYKAEHTADAVVAAVEVEIAKIATDGVDAAALARVKTKMLSQFYGGGYGGLETFLWRADALAKTQALWGDANQLNRVPQWIEAVTSADVQRAAKTYLVAANRSVIDRRPVAAEVTK